MNDEKEYTEGIAVKENKFLTWFDNYWYHYKWVTIVVAFAVIVFSICIIQSCTTEKTDVLISYAGPVYFNPENSAAIDSALNKALNEEDGKDKLKISFKPYYVLTTEQIEELKKETDSEGRPKNDVNTSFNGQEFENFKSQLMSGSSAIIFIDKDMYKMFFDEKGTAERLQPLSEVLGTTPANAVDAYGVRLGDTELYKSYPDIRRLPEDTLVCLHRKIGTQKAYDKQVEVFKKITKEAKDGGN